MFLRKFKMKSETLPKNLILLFLCALILTFFNGVFFTEYARAYSSNSELADAYFYIGSKWENEKLAALKVFIDNEAEAAVPRILKVLNDDSDAVRKLAAEAVLRLGHTGDRISVPALIERIAIEPKPEVLETLLFALASFSEEENTVMTLREAFKKAAREQKYNIIDSLHPLIKSHRRAFVNFFEILSMSVIAEDELQRLHAVVAMGEFGDMDYVLKPMLRTITDANIEVRSVTCRYFGVLRPFEALNPLIDRGLNDISPAVRKEAVMAVAQYKHAGSFEFFKKVVSGDIDGETRAAAALAFIGLADRRAIAPLKIALLDSANVVRLNSAYALTFFDSYEGEGELVWFLWEQNLPEYRRRAAKGLANIRSRTVLDDLERALKDWDDEVRDTAFYALRHKWGYRITQ